MKIICKFTPGGCKISGDEGCCFECDKKKECNQVCISYKDKLIESPKECSMSREIEGE